MSWRSCVGRRTREIALPDFEQPSSCRVWVRQRPRVFLTASPQSRMRSKRSKPSARLLRLHNSGHKSAGWPAELDLICRWYMPHLDRLYEDAVMRQADLAQLVQISSTYPTRERFLTELTLDPP